MYVHEVVIKDIYCRQMLKGELVLNDELFGALIYNDMC